LDGYLHRALVFLDLNNNGRHDQGEPSTQTAIDGTFTLTVPEAQASSAPLVVSSIAGQTSDSDTPGTTVARDLTLTAPIGQSRIISPLTTLVAARMVSGLSLEAARRAVALDLAITETLLMSDYVGGADTPERQSVHRLAVALAELIGTLEAKAGPNAALRSRFEALSSQFATTVLPRVADISAAPSLAAARAIVDDAIDEQSATWPVAGTIEGLVANGLKLTQGGESIELAAAAKAFSFAQPLRAGASYQIGILSQPSGQSCSIDQAAGTVSADLDQRIVVRCLLTPGQLSGTVSGLAAPGLVLANGASELPIPMGAASFRFETAINAGSNYEVRVAQHPAAQFCSISRALGTMTPGGVNNVEVTCSAGAYTVGGSIRGLTAEGLTLVSGPEQLSIAAGASSFQFNERAAYGSSYSVAIGSQPAGLYCSAADSAGTVGLAAVQSIDVACAPQGSSYRIAGTISGLDTAGLVLRLGEEAIAVSSGVASFQFQTRVADGGRYSVVIDAQPDRSTCLLSQAAGLVSGADVGQITVACRNKTLYALGNSALSIVDLVSGARLQSLSFASAPAGIATSPRSNFVVVADSFGQIHMVDDRVRTVVASLTVGGVPTMVLSDPSGRRIYLFEESADRVRVIETADEDPRKWQVSASIQVGDGPVAAYVSSVRPHVYVVNRAAASVSVIHTASLSVIRTYEGLGIAPSAITAGPGEGVLYLADSSARTMIELDLATGSTISYFLDGKPEALARSPDGREIYVLNSELDTMMRFDTATKAMNSVTVGESPLAIAVSPRGGDVYVVDLNQPIGVTVVDPRSMRVLRRTPLDALPLGVVIR
jgi:YVTN family beta-propeller protein